ncbi:MAG: 16S rRNA (cytosine(1402)-N(4))-methyltransferase RsmH [Bacilli bacterium]
MHKSVLLTECLELLNLNEASIVVDCTLGYGGHSREILKRIKRGFLFAFDQDVEAIESSSKLLETVGSNFTIIYSNFSNLTEELKNRNITKVDAVLFDLGVSSPQLDTDARGFSFHNDAWLDMRMDKNRVLTAYKVVNDYSQDDLVKIFFEYGDEKYARSIAKSIVLYREGKKISTTLELVEIIKKSVPESYKRGKHPARKVFQALRIEVNNELAVFADGLRQAINLLSVGGRVGVITFHSLEDVICKRIFKEYSMLDNNLKKLPVVPYELLPKFKMFGSVKPGDREILENKRSRSARLRVIERVRD